jgi:hypothetical protein
MRRLLFALMIIGCLIFSSCRGGTEKGLTPSYSFDTLSQSGAETAPSEQAVVTAETGGIELLYSAKECMAYSLGELVGIFSSLGFYDIEIIPCELTAVEIQKDKVLAVLVDGDSDFKKSSVYSKDAKIRILYAVFSCDASVSETETEVSETTEVSQIETVVGEGEDIFVYVTESGSKYHSNPSCSDMKAPKKLTLSEAEALEYTPCKRCH